MGKAKIVSHLGEGKYSVQLYHNIAKVEFKKARLNDNLTQVNADITTKEADKTTAESDLALASNNYQSLINAYADCLKANDNNQDKCKNQYNGMMERYAEFVEAQQLVNSLNQSLDSLYVIKQRLERDIAVLNNVHDEWTQMNIWCADLCDGDLGDVVIPDNTEVATIDIYSFSDKKYEHWIVPSSYGRDNSYTESINGNIKSSLSNNEYGFVYNWNMLGPQMAWSPAYRLATITSIDTDNNRASVSYFDLTDEDGVNFNGHEPTANIAFDYMLYNHTSFRVGDGVIVSFCEAKFGDALIIGFYANPKAETLDFYIYAKLFTNQFSTLYNDMLTAQPTIGDVVEGNTPLVRTSPYPANSFTRTLGGDTLVVFGACIDEWTIRQPTLVFQLNGSSSVDTPIGISAGSFYLTWNGEYVFSISYGYNDIVGGHHIEDANTVVYYKIYYPSNGIIEVTKYAIDTTTWQQTQVNFITYTHSHLFKPGSWSNDSRFWKRLLVEQLRSAVYIEANMVANSTGTEVLFTSRDNGGATQGQYPIESGLFKIIDNKDGNISVEPFEIISNSLPFSENWSALHMFCAFDNDDNIITLNMNTYGSRVDDGDVIERYSQIYVNDTLVTGATGEETSYDVHLHLFNLKYKSYLIGTSSQLLPYGTTSHLYIEGVNISSKSTSGYTTAGQRESWVRVGSYSLFAGTPDGIVLIGPDTIPDSVLYNLSPQDQSDTMWSYVNTYIGVAKTNAPDLDKDVVNHLSSDAFIPPSLKIINIKIVSNNANTQFAKTGDTITLTFERTVSITTLTCSIAGSSVTPSLSGDNYTATYTVNGTESESSVAFNITADGDSFEQTSGSGRCSKVIIDYTKPSPTITDNFSEIYNAAQEKRTTLERACDADYAKCNSSGVKSSICSDGISACYQVAEDNFNRDAFIFTFTIDFAEGGLNYLPLASINVTNAKKLLYKKANDGLNKYILKVKATSEFVNLSIASGTLTDRAGNDNDLVNYNATT